MTTLLFYDTETTGLPLWKEPSEHPDQPHITQIAALLTDAAGAKLASIDLLVRPDGWTIPQDLQEMTGITMDRATQGGVPEGVALSVFEALWRRADVRIGHNETFDARILRIGFKRFAGICDPDVWKAGPAECTQKLALPIMRMPPTDRMVAAGFGGRSKPPKLEEAYQHFMGRPMQGAHNAAADVVACKAVFFAIKAQSSLEPTPAAQPTTGTPPVARMAEPAGELTEAV